MMDGWVEGWMNVHCNEHLQKMYMFLSVVKSSSVAVVLIDRRSVYTNPTTWIVSSLHTFTFSAEWYNVYWPAEHQQQFFLRLCMSIFHCLKSLEQYQYLVQQQCLFIYYYYYTRCWHWYCGPGLWASPGQSPWSSPCSLHHWAAEWQGDFLPSGCGTGASAKVRWRPAATQANWKGKCYIDHSPAGISFFEVLIPGEI